MNFSISININSFFLNYHSNFNSNYLSIKEILLLRKNYQINYYYIIKFSLIMKKFPFYFNLIIFTSSKSKELIPVKY